jgi:hypothetical protein
LGKRAPQILLVNPWITDFAAYDFWIKPVGLLTLGRLLKDAGCRTTLLDCLDRTHPALKSTPEFKTIKSRADGTGHFHKETIEKPSPLKNIPRQYSRYGLPLELVSRLLKNMDRPDAILVTSGMTYWYPGVRQMIRLLKSVFPGVPVALGGIYATLCPDHAKKTSGADQVIQGEGDEAVLKLVDEWCGWASPSELADEIAIPDFSHYDPMLSAALLTSRGCPYRCPYCASHLLSKKSWRLPPERVIEQVRDLYKKGVTEFAFYDDALLVQKESHFYPMITKVIASGLPVHFHTPNGLHPKLIDEALAGLMVQSGFRTVRLSYETCNPERQRRTGMKVSDSDLKQAVRFLRNAGMHPDHIGSYVLMGLPDQPLSEVLDSLRVVFDLGIRVSLASFSPIPGTQSWDEAVESGFLSPDADPLLTNNSVFPLRSESIPFRDFIEIGTLAAQGNWMIRKRQSPFKDPDFVKKAKRFASNEK